MTDQCVSGTVRDLSDESFHVWLIEDACLAATRELHEHELTVLNNIYCHVITTQELLNAIGRSGTARNAPAACRSAGKRTACPAVYGLEPIARRHPLCTR